MKIILLTIISFFYCFLSAQELDSDALFKNNDYTPIELEVLNTGASKPSVNNNTLSSNQITTQSTASKPFPSSNEYLGAIQSEASVTLSGGFSYTVPIEVPLGINGLEPKLNLSYNSQSSSGLLGVGWNLTGVSSISRIPKTKYHNGENKPIAFNHTDALALDGQRLINVSPPNSVNGVYETENKSTLRIVQDPTPWNTDPNNHTAMEGNFTVYYPNGSKGRYDLQTGLEWLLTSYEDINGNVMEYSYIENKGRYYISKIHYGHKKGGSPLNTVSFEYSFKESPTMSYIDGKEYINWYYLRKIKTFYKELLLFNYTLDYQATPTGIRLHKVNQYNRDNKARAPLEFSYPNPYNTKGMAHSTSYSNLNDGLGGSHKNRRQVSGDFNGDGQQDFLLYEKELKNKLAFFKGYFDDGLYYKPSLSATTTSIVGQPFEKFEGIFTRTFLNSSNQYLSQNDGITFVTSNKDKTDQTSFSFYTTALGVSSLYIQDVKTVSINHPSDYKFIGEPTFYKGDYNSNGITDVIMLHRVSYPVLGAGGRIHEGIRAFYIDLDRRKKADSPIYIGGYRDNPNYPSYNESISDLHFLNIGAPSGIADDEGYAILSGDFVGNGKTDFAVKKQGIITVFSYNENTHELEKKTELYDGLIKMNTLTLVGDFNGDGKADLLTPEAENSYKWWVFHSTGKQFNKQPKSNVVTTYYRDQDHAYTTMDYNRDGKSDIMYIRFASSHAYASLYYSHTSPYYPNVGAGKPAKDLAETIFLPEQENFDMGGGISSEDPLLGFDLSTTGKSHFQIGFYKQRSTGNTINSYHFLRDTPTYNRLQSVIDHSNGKTLDIEYNLDELEKKSVYSKQNNQAYPFVNVNSVDRMALVASLHESYNRKVYRSQDFRYEGAVSHLDGLGYLGFSAMAKSSWYSSESEKDPLWTISYYNPTKRGQLEKAYTSLSFNGFREPSGRLVVDKKEYTYTTTLSANQDSKYFENVSDNLNLNTEMNNTSQVAKRSIRLTNGFKADGSKGSFRASILANSNGTGASGYAGVYSSFPKDITSYDALKGTTTKQHFTYDDFGNATKVITDYGSGNIETKDIVFNNENAPNGTYFRSRIETETTTQNFYHATFENSTEYQYDDKGRLENTIKKGNKTSDSLKENLTYDSFGNITKRILSIEGETPREESFTYDSTGRFLVTSTDTKGLVTTKEYYEETGLLKKETSPFGLETSYIYDNWLRPKTVTDYLGNTLTYYYEKTSSDAIAEGDLKNGGFYVFEDATQGRDKKTYYDVIGRAYKESTLSLDRKWVSVETKYDIQDRETKKSDPYFDKPSLWTENTYDVYSRLTGVKAPSGKVTRMTYEGLSVTTDDGIQTQTQTADNVGNILSKTDDGGTILYSYYPNGTPKHTQYADHVIEIEQDGWGRKTKLTDSAAGVYEYRYNGFGEIIQEIMPKGKNNYTYNSLGLLINKTIEDPVFKHPISTNYTYNTETFLLEKEESYTSNLNTVTYTYDEYLRLKKTVEDNPEVSFTKEITYDGYGNVLNETSTSLLKGHNLSSTSSKTYQYEAGSGLLEKILNDKGEALYHITALNEREQLIGADYLNGLQIYNVWSDLGHLVSAKEFSTNKVALDYEYNFDPIRGNLLDRKNNAFANPIEEHFSYDVLDRLNRITIEGKNPSMLSYDKTGKITNNDQIGEYKYQGDTSFKLDRIKLNDKGKERFKERTLQQATFTSFKKPLEITEKNSGSVVFEYNGSLTRSKSIFKDQNGTITKVKFYSRDGENEIVIPSNKKDIKLISYLGGAYGSNIAYISTFNHEGTLKESNDYFLHRDYLGSIVAISDLSGEILEKRHYGAWGKLDQYQSSKEELTEEDPLLDRGWTGHEHLDNVHLVHMNGRLYDSDLKRMLSPDNYVQDPSNTQNFNRYQYGFNNPLKWTDPSGEALLPILGAFTIGALLGGASYAVFSVVEGFSFNWGDFFKSTLIGGVSGVISFGIGKAGLDMVTNSLAHAVSSGVISAVDTGDFATGFLSGGLSSIASAGTLSLKIEKQFIKYAVTEVTGAVVGGVGSVLGGGDFWRGARQGFITTTLNHIATYIRTGIEYNKIQKQQYNKIGVNNEAYKMANFGLTDPPTKSWYERIYQYFTDNIVSPAAVTSSYLVNIIGGGIYGGTLLTIDHISPNSIDIDKLMWTPKIVRFKNGEIQLTDLPDSGDLIIKDFMKGSVNTLINVYGGYPKMEVFGGIEFILSDQISNKVNNTIDDL